MYFSNPKRAEESHSLPDIETLYVNENELEEFDVSGPGWYWQPGLPGCMPDSDPNGPHESELDAINEAREHLEWDDIKNHLQAYAITKQYMSSDYDVVSLIDALKPSGASIVAIVVTWQDIDDQIILEWFKTHQPRGKLVYTAF